MSLLSFWIACGWAAPAAFGAAQPDLVFSGFIGASPNPVTAGNSVMISYTIRNQGTASAGFSNTGIEIRDTFGITLVEEIYGTSPIAVGASVSESRSVSIPSSASGGNYTIIVTLDYFSAINQSDESNDIATRSLSIVAARPDLIVSGGLVTVSPDPVTAGNNVTVSYTIRNQGNGSAGVSRTRVQIKTDFLPIQTWVDEIHATGVIPTGSSLSESTTVFISGSAPAGQYSAYVILDIFNEINQSNTSNDQASRSFRVNAPPEITVTGNGVSITDGDSTPGTLDGTDFGSVVEGQPGVSRVFTVRNDGGSTLTLGPVSVPGGFTLVEGLFSSLSPGASDTFTIRLDSATPGTKNGQVSFSNNDSNENPFNFSIMGMVLALPEITVTCNGVSITDGDITPSPTDCTDFGSVVEGQPGPSRTFTVRNDGGSTLTLGSVSVPAGFTLTEGLPANLAAGASDSFTIRLESAVVGSKIGDVSFSNNDGNENPFNFSIAGTVLALPEIRVTCNGVSITDGDITPSPTGCTDIGTVVEGQPGPSRTFTVWNDGGSTLTLGSISVPSGFTVIEGLSASLGGGASDTFTIRLDTVTPGTKSGQVSFGNSDSDENPFNFVIMGTVIAADSDDQISEATWIADMTRTIADGVAGTIDQATDVDMWFINVAPGQRISVDVDIPSGSGLDPNLRLFDGNGTELASNHGGHGPGDTTASDAYLEYTFASGGRYYVGVSTYPNTGYNPNNGSGDAPGNSTGPYNLVLSPGLAGTIRRNGEAIDYPVDILRVDSPIGAYPRAIDPQKKTWIIVHGWNSFRGEDNISSLAQAVTNHRPGDQVLTLDWSSAAITGAGACRASIAIEPVAEWASDALQDYQFPNGNLNFIGHSYGSYVSAETAERIPGGVDTIVGLDPAQHFAPCAYNPNTEVNFSGVSRFSWAFHTSFLGSELTPATAHEGFVIPHPHPCEPLFGCVEDHSRAIEVFVGMLGNPSGVVSHRFQLQRLQDHTPGPWCPDRYTSHANPRGGGGEEDYEAIIEPTPDGLYPESITYVTNCATGQEVTEVEVPDSVNPSVTINLPTTEPAYESFSGVVDLFGSASDNVRVKTVNWVNNRGGTGLAAGAGNWVAGSIALQEGQNVITVTARDVAGNTASDVITVTYEPVNLTVLSSNPDSGVTIGVAPSDKNLRSDGTTAFTRRYDKATSVSLIAPASVGCNDFVKWQRDGSDWSHNRTTSVTMDAAHSMRAVFATKPARVIHVDCAFAGGGSDGSPARPFRTVREAYEAACNGDTIRISGCNYPEAITMNKALRLEAVNGAANLGRTP